MQAVVRDLHAHFVRVGTSFVSQPSRHQTNDNESSPTVEPHEVHLQTLARTLAWNYPARCQFPGCHRISFWLREFYAEKESCTFISWHELFVSFQLETQLRGVKKATLVDWTLLSQHDPWQFTRHCRAFGKFFVALCKTVWPDFVGQFAKPSNPLYGAWTSGIWARVTMTARARWTQWMREHVPVALVTRVGAQLGALPEAHDEPKA